MLAKELKEISNKTRLEQEKIRASKLAEHAKVRATEMATSSPSGATTVTIYLKSEYATAPGWNKKDALAAVPLLEKEGFACKVTTEIGAWYSNTDYDVEDILVISWENA